MVRKVCWTGATLVFGVLATVMVAKAQSDENIWYHFIVTDPHIVPALVAIMVGLVALAAGQYETPKRFYWEAMKLIFPPKTSSPDSRIIGSPRDGLTPELEKINQHRVDLLGQEIARLKETISELEKPRSISVLRPIDPKDFERRNSPEDSVKSRIGFFNRSNKSVDIFWIDYSGNRKHYELIEIGGEWWCPRTYQGHLWLIVEHESGASACGFEVLPAETNIAFIAAVIEQGLSVAKSTVKQKPILELYGIEVLENVIWRGSEPSNGTQLYGLKIRNKQLDVHRTAMNTRATIAFSHDSAEFLVKETVWLMRLSEQRPEGRVAWVSETTDISSGEVKCLLIAATASHPPQTSVALTTHSVGHDNDSYSFNLFRMLGFGKWTCDITVQADMLDPLCLSVSFNVDTEGRVVNFGAGLATA